MPQKIEPPKFRNRVVGLKRLQARALQAHDGNWRVHPQHQQDAMTGVLKEIGIAGALLVYRSPAQHGKYVVIDGHLRKEWWREPGTPDIPCPRRHGTNRYGLPRGPVVLTD